MWWWHKNNHSRCGDGILKNNNGSGLGIEVIAGKKGKKRK